MNFRDQTLQLISADQFDNLHLNAQAKQYLLSINKPISIISVAGMYRSGKSYLANRLLKTKQNGFGVGATTQPVTKGLNIWGRPILANDETGQQFNYLVIDSEGLGSCEKDVQYEIKILKLIFMLSSTVVYNSIGAIDEQALQQLKVLINLRNTFSAQPSKERTRLVWVLRDFAQQLVDKNGIQITSNQYLQQCLQDAAGNTLEIKKKNEIRCAIRQGLGKRTCFTLVRPTMNQADSVDLSRCKLRTEFVNQIQTIRSQIFSGSSQDLKRINGQLINGRLLVALIEQSIQVLNGNRMPHLLSIWETVRIGAYQQLFSNICQDMKLQMRQIVLPISKQELQLRVNEIQHKHYTKLEQSLIQLDTFKHYHKQFLKQLQKITIKIKNANLALIKEKRLKELRQFVKQNISFTHIQPTNMSLIKIVIDRMELKVHGEPQGYQYTLSVLFDLMRICEQKALNMHKQLLELRRAVEVGSTQQKNHYLVALTLKKDYHEALKTINSLKMVQQESQKQIALSKHQLQVQINSFRNLQQQGQLKESGLLRQIQDLNFKNRQKNDQLSNTIKRLRQQNTQIMFELSHMKEQKVKEGLSERRQAIFQQKMKQTSQKFDQQRKQMRIQLEKCSKNVQSWRSKYERQQELRQQQQERLTKEQELFAQKQREFVYQIKQLKKMHAQAKKTYNATFETLKNTGRVLKDVQNVPISNTKLSCSRQLLITEKQVEGIKKKYQEQILKLKLQHQAKIKYLNSEIQRLKKVIGEHKSRNAENQSQLRRCFEEKQALETEVATLRLKFVNSITKMENAKQRERTLYEQSLVRLLSNIDRRQRGEYNSSYK